MSSIQIEIEFGGDMMEFGVDRNATILDLKSMIKDRASISISQQKLLFTGRRLDNKQSLAYYNIGDKNSLVLKRQATSRQFWISFIYFGSFIGLGLFMGSPGPILKELQIQTNSTLGYISFVFSARAIGYIIGSIIFGLISDKYASYYNKYGKFNSPCFPFRPHHLFGICLIILSACMSVLFLITDIVSLIILMSITGICSGGIDCFGNVLLLSLFDTDNEKDNLVAPYMQLLHFAFAIGAFLSPLVIQLSYDILDGSYQAGFWIMSAEAIIFGIIILFIATPLRKRREGSSTGVMSINGGGNMGHGLHMRQRTNDSQVSTENISITSDRKQQVTYGSFDQSGSGGSQYGVNIIAGGNESGIDDDGNTSISSNEQRKRFLYKIFIVLSCAIFLGIYVGSEVAYGAYITVYSIDHLFTTSAIGRYMSSIYWGGLSFGRLSAVYISKKLKPVHMLIFDLLGCFVASSILFIFNNSTDAAWIASVLYGFFMASIFPCIFLIAEQTVKVDGRYASIMIFGASCGEFIIPTTEGNLMAILGEQHFSSITIILVIILFCVMLILLFGIYISDITKKITQFFSM